MKNKIMSLLALSVMGISGTASADPSVNGSPAKAIWDDLEHSKVATVEGDHRMTKVVGRLECVRKHEEHLIRNEHEYSCTLHDPIHHGGLHGNNPMDSNDIEIFFALSDPGEWGMTRTTGPLHCNAERRGQDNHGEGRHPWGGRHEMPNSAVCYFN